MTDRLKITGGVPLCGTVIVSGSKNAALPIMAAAILTDEPVTLQRIPDLSDVSTLAEVLIELGLDVGRTGDQLRITTLDTRTTTAPYRLVRRMRASFCVLGPLLARRGYARVALPGGCNLGHRPVDLHLRGLAALGADIRIQRGYVVARAERLRGARINMLGPHGPTVTGTANILCAATLARGTTVIEGAACEPEIVDLADFLVKIGARVEGAGTSTIVIHGVGELGGATHRVIPDRIETATLLLAGAITGGCVRVEGAHPGHLMAVLDALLTTGAQISIHRSAIEIAVPDQLRAVSAIATPYPGFPSDVQPQWMALASAASGRCVIRDEVFPHRLGHVADLCRLGARIEIDREIAAVEGRGNRSFHAAPVLARDLRSGAALLLAALCAQGTTTLRGARRLDRGYERLEERLTRLGARLSRSERLGNTICSMVNDVGSMAPA